MFTFTLGSAKVLSPPSFFSSFSSFSRFPRKDLPQPYSPPPMRQPPFSSSCGHCSTRPLFPRHHHHHLLSLSFICAFQFVRHLIVINLTRRVHQHITSLLIRAITTSRVRRVRLLLSLWCDGYFWFLFCARTACIQTINISEELE